jgi:aminoglycoside 6-adenylyltransferase
LREKIFQWAADNDDIRAVIETGAAVRRDHPADEFSDLDIELYFRDYAPYAARSDWFEAFGAVGVYLPLHVDGGFPSRLVIYEGGAKVDFLLYDVEELKRRTQWQELPDISHRGYKVPLDKDGIAARIPLSPFAAPPLKDPTFDEFDYVVREFWFEAFHVAKYLRRGDLWPAKFREREVHDNLLRMMEWHARFVRGAPDIWFQGRFLREWTDAETYSALRGVFANFDRESTARALLETTALFRRLTREVAAALEFDYQAELDENMSRFITAVMKEITPT